MHNLRSKFNKEIIVKKASGEEEPFNSEKLERSLMNAGAKPATIDKIFKDLENRLHRGVPTKKIYSRAFSILQKERTASSLRYKLKKAILEIGPTGYPFETLIGELFQHLDYKTEVGMVVEGRCVTHEIDVIATNENVQHLVECKYHKDQGKQVSIQVPLYVRSRVDDIIKKRQEMISYEKFSFKGWVITNTRFSLDSIKYGNCSGLNLLAWDYPSGNGLKENLEKYKIYPITVLSNLTLKERQYLLDKGIVTCSQLKKNLGALAELNLTKSKQNMLLKELNMICQ